MKGTKSNARRMRRIALMKDKHRCEEAESLRHFKPKVFKDATKYNRKKANGTVWE